MPAVLRTVTATRYVTPLREGGSLPGDRGGRRRRPLRPEVPRRRARARRRSRPRSWPASWPARSGCRCPELVLIELDPALGAAEPDPEIQDLIAASGGRQPRASTSCRARCPYTPDRPPEPELAADVVWLDALVTNVDRTPRNPNLLRWHGNLWLIDHGAALYVAPRRGDPLARARRPLPGDPRPRAAAAPPARSPRPTRGSPPQADPADARAALVPPDWADGDAVRRASSTRAARGAARAWSRRPSVPGREPFQYACAARRPARRARRGRQRRRRAVLPPAALPRRPHGARRGAARRARRPGCDPAEVRAQLETLERSPTAATRRAGRSRRCRSRSASTG